MNRRTFCLTPLFLSITSDPEMDLFIERYRQGYIGSKTFKRLVRGLGRRPTNRRLFVGAPPRAGLSFHAKSMPKKTEKSSKYWSGRRESNPRMQLGKLPRYHCQQFQ